MTKTADNPMHLKNAGAITFALGTTLPSADEAREAMPVAGKTRLPNVHGGAAGSGAPKGKRNHGGFTTEAIDERRRLASLIHSRDFLSRLR
jgi:hypothetical protein